MDDLSNDLSRYPAMMARYEADLTRRRVLRVRHPDVDDSQYPGRYEVQLRGAPGAEVLELPVNWHFDARFLGPLVEAVRITIAHNDGDFPAAGAITARVINDVERREDVHPETAEFYRRLAQAFDTILAAGAHPMQRRPPAHEACGGAYRGRPTYWPCTAPPSAAR